MYDINKIADYFIWLHHEFGDVITNLRLQKLVYYAQAWYLALNNEKLFDEDFEAWIHGPVNPSLYDRFKKYKWNPISEEISKPELDPEVEKHLKEIMEVYSGFSSYELETISHKEEPWVNARGDLPFDAPSSNIISQDDMKSYYKNFSKSDG